jgi:hypothetical protein
MRWGAKILCCNEERCDKFEQCSDEGVEISCYRGEKSVKVYIFRDESGVRELKVCVGMKNFLLTLNKVVIETSKLTVTWVKMCVES